MYRTDLVRMTPQRATPPLAASRRASNRLDPSDLPAEPGMAGCWAAGVPVVVLQTRPGSAVPGLTAGSVATPPAIAGGACWAAAAAAAAFASALFQPGTTDAPCGGLPGGAAFICAAQSCLHSQVNRVTVIDRLACKMQAYEQSEVSTMCEVCDLSIGAFDRPD